jgi:hypothetical protein
MNLEIEWYIQNEGIDAQSLLLAFSDGEWLSTTDYTQEEVEEADFILKGMIS